MFASNAYNTFPNYLEDQAEKLQDDFDADYIRERNDFLAACERYPAEAQHEYDVNGRIPPAPRVPQRRTATVKDGRVVYGTDPADPALHAPEFLPAPPVMQSNRIAAPAIESTVEKDLALVKLTLAQVLDELKALRMCLVGVK